MNGATSARCAGRIATHYFCRQLDGMQRADLRLVTHLMAAGGSGGKDYGVGGEIFKVAGQGLREYLLRKRQIFFQKAE